MTTEFIIPKTKSPTRNLAKEQTKVLEDENEKLRKENEDLKKQLKKYER